MLNRPGGEPGGPGESWDEPIPRESWREFYLTCSITVKRLGRRIRTWRVSHDPRSGPDFGHFLAAAPLIRRASDDGPRPKGCFHAAAVTAKNILEYIRIYIAVACDSEPAGVRRMAGLFIGEPVFSVRKVRLAGFGCFVGCGICDLVC